MIISHKYKFIFIKTYKTAGTSIEVFLSQCCSDNDILTPIIPHVAPHVARNYQSYWNPLPEMINFDLVEMSGMLRDIKKKRRFYNHIPARTVSKRIPKTMWNSYYKFCVERNPWDKTLSHYHMVKDRLGGSLTLEGYFDKGEFCVNYPQYTDKSGVKIIVDKIIKYENLVEELGAVFKETGVPFDNSLGVRAKSDHRKDRTSYEEIFNGRQKSIIERVFSYEIEMLGYTF